MFCMKTYGERLALAMKARGLNPASDQSTLARMVGHGCKPQNIQHLLDPNKNAQSSKYSAAIAEALHCDVGWLSYGVGTAPVSTPRGADAAAKDNRNELFVEATSLLRSMDAVRLKQATSILRVLIDQEAALPNLDRLMVEVPAEPLPASSPQRQRRRKAPGAA